MVSCATVWPQEVVATTSRSSLNLLEQLLESVFSSLSCDLPSIFTPVGKFAFLLLLPAVCMVSLALFFTILFTYRLSRPHERHIENVHLKCHRSAFFCLSFSYFPILRPCHSDQDVLYMPNFPWIECTSHTYNTLRALGAVSVHVVFCVIGFPLLLISLMIGLFRKRHITSPEDCKKLDAWPGPIYSLCKAKYQALP